MSKGKNTTPVAFRLHDETYAVIAAKAATKDLSIGEYCKQLVLKEALRSHHKKGQPSTICGSIHHVSVGGACPDDCGTCYDRIINKE